MLVSVTIFFSWKNEELKAPCIWCIPYALAITVRALMISLNEGRRTITCSDTPLLLRTHIARHAKQYTQPLVTRLKPVQKTHFSGSVTASGQTPASDR